MQEPLGPVSCPLSKYQWKRTEKEPKACPRIVDKHLLQILTRKAGDARILLTVDQMKTLGLGHMCWDGYVEVGNQFYRPLLPPIIKEGMIQEIRNMWQYVAIPYQELHDHHIPTIPDMYMVPFHNQTGMVMTRDVDGCLQLRFPGHHNRVKLCEQQAPYIKANEPLCTWKIIALTTPTMAVAAPCRQRTTVHSRQRQIPLTTVRWILTQQALGCKNGVACDFKADLTTTQKERCLQHLGMRFDLQRPEMLLNANASEVVRETKSNSNIGPTTARRYSTHITDAHMEGKTPVMPGATSQYPCD
jgi:hypothetical protein